MTVLYVFTRFQADSSFRSKVIRASHNFEIRSRDPGHAHLGADLYSVRRKGPSSIPVPNFKQTALFRQKLLGSKNFEIAWRDHKQHPFWTWNVEFV